MESDFPNTIFEPRDTENLPGIVFDATKKTYLFSEDYQNLGAEIEAIETDAPAISGVVSFKPVFVSTGVTVDPDMKVGYFFKNADSPTDDYSNNANFGIETSMTYSASGGPDHSGGFISTAVNGYIKTTTNFSLGTSYTIQFWYMPATIWNAFPYREMEFGAYDNGWSIMAMDLYINGQNNLSAGYTPPQSQWHHYTYTVDGATKLVTLYIDGVFYKSATYTTNIDSTAREFDIGAQASGGGWESNGNWADVVITNRLKNSTEVLADFTNGGYSFGAITGYVRPQIYIDTDGNIFCKNALGQINKIST